MRSAALATLALVMAACTGAATQPVSRTAPPVTTGLTAPPSTPPTTEPARPGYEVRPCGDPLPVDFALLCEAFNQVAEGYIDPVDPDSLAAAAVLGVQTAIDEAVELRDQPLDCVVPHDAFESVCAAIVDRYGGPPRSARSGVEAAVQGMFRFGLDPFSTYVPPDFVDRIDPEGTGFVYELGMVVAPRDPKGAVCGPISSGCLLTVISVFPFTAADRAGIIAGDVITGIDGRRPDGLSGTEAVALLGGPAGSTVVVALAGSGGSVERTLVREDIRFLPAEFEVISLSIAYLRLNEFSQLSAQLTGQALRSDEVQGADWLILDLRDNPGGLLLAAQAVASQFLDGGLVMVESGRDWSFEVPVVSGGLAVAGPELVVLVNRGSASASEVVAAVLQERGRAIVVGEPTFGKNLVQEVTTTRNGGEIRVTVSRWTTPEGRDIGLMGLAPDIQVERMPAADGDPILERALAEIGG